MKLGLFICAVSMALLIVGCLDDDKDEQGEEVQTSQNQPQPQPQPTVVITTSVDIVDCGLTNEERALFVGGNPAVNSWADCADRQKKLKQYYKKKLEDFEQTVHEATGVGGMGAFVRS